MPKVSDRTRSGVEPVEPGPRGQPQHAGAILGDMHHGSAETAGLRWLDVVVGEGLVARIEAIEYLVTPYPQQAGAVLEQRGDPRSGETVRPQRIVHIHFEFIPVIAVEAILGAKPHESPVVLDDLGDAGLRKSVRC